MPNKVVDLRLEVGDLMSEVGDLKSELESGDPVGSRQFNPLLTRLKSR